MNEDDDEIDAEAPQADPGIATAELDDPELADEDSSGDDEEADEVTTHGSLKDDDDG
jgi:hypothetical protein